MFRLKKNFLPGAGDLTRIKYGFSFPLSPLSGDSGEEERVTRAPEGCEGAKLLQAGAEGGGLQ